MPCHVAKSIGVSARPRRQIQRQAPPPLPSLAVLDLNKPPERAAHDFLLRATSKPDRFWKVLDIRRQGDTLLCVVRWVHPDNLAKPFSLAELSLTEAAVCWRDYPTVEAARTEMARRGEETVPQEASA